jgi:hypothetical protein
MFNVKRDIAAIFREATEDKDKKVCPKCGKDPCECATKKESGSSCKESSIIDDLFY